MTDMTVLLGRAADGDPLAAAEVLPLVYDELRKLARARMSQERPDDSLAPTALVHEAYLRLVGSTDRPKWRGRGHFFAAAAQAMRRILVERARQRNTLRRGGGVQERVELDAELLDVSDSNKSDDELLAIHEALERLAVAHAEAAQLVELRFFAGFTIPEAAESLGISPRKANDLWAYGRVWLAAEMERE